MIYAVISDVHGNRWALEAVLHDISSRHVDVLVNLGDSVYGPLQPHETAALLRESCEIHILGNQDRILLDAPSHPLSPTLASCFRSLTDDDVEWLRGSHKSSITLDNLLLVHGTLQYDSDYLLEDIARGIPSLLSDDRIALKIGHSDAKIILCGHSHIARYVRMRDRTIINPGSVGLQAYDDDSPVAHRMEMGSPHARYAIIEVDGERVTVNHLAIPYDYREAAALALQNGRSDWAYWLEHGRTRTP